jgi:hypothetical protein
MWHFSGLLTTKVFIVYTCYLSDTTLSELGSPKLYCSRIYITPVLPKVKQGNSTTNADVRERAPLNLPAIESHHISRIVVRPLIVA